jgi:hypothetical protein
VYVKIKFKLYLLPQGFRRSPRRHSLHIVAATTFPQPSSIQTQPCAKDTVWGNFSLTFSIVTSTGGKAVEELVVVWTRKGRRGEHKHYIAVLVSAHPFKNAPSTERISILHRHMKASNSATSVSPKPSSRPRSQTLTSGRLRMRPWNWRRRRLQRHLVARLCHLRASRPLSIKPTPMQSWVSSFRES